MRIRSRDVARRRRPVCIQESENSWRVNGGGGHTGWKNEEKAKFSAKDERARWRDVISIGEDEDEAEEEQEEEEEDDDDEIRERKGWGTGVGFIVTSIGVPVARARAHCEYAPTISRAERTPARFHPLPVLVPPIPYIFRNIYVRRGETEEEAEEVMVEERGGGWRDGRKMEIEKVRVTYYYELRGADGVDPLDGCLMKDA